MTYTHLPPIYTALVFAPRKKRPPDGKTAIFHVLHRKGRTKRIIIGMGLNVVST